MLPAIPHDNFINIFQLLICEISKNNAISSMSPEMDDYASFGFFYPLDSKPHILIFKSYEVPRLNIIEAFTNLLFRSPLFFQGGAIGLRIFPHKGSNSENNNDSRNKKIRMPMPLLHHSSLHFI